MILSVKCRNLEQIEKCWQYEQAFYAVSTEPGGIEPVVHWARLARVKVLRSWRGIFLSKLKKNQGRKIVFLKQFIEKIFLFF